MAVINLKSHGYTSWSCEILSLLVFHAPLIPIIILDDTSDRRYTDYKIFSLNFFIYTLSGVWRPVEWSSKRSKLLYGIFTVITVYLMNFSMMTQLLDMILVIDNMDDFATTNIMFFSAAGSFCKAVTAVIQRNQIISLMKLLTEEPYKTRDDEEIAIQMKYDNFIRSVSVSYTLLASFSATGATVGELFAVSHGELPYRAWVPYDYTSLSLFWLTSLQEMLALILGTMINVATETLLFGFCLQTCAQFEILTHRLRKVAQERETETDKGGFHNDTSKDTFSKTKLSQHIYHHLCIIKFARKVNEVFSQVLFVQFFGSILILCSTVYYLSSHKTLADFMSLVVYTFCMFMQVFIYCWAGNEVMLKSVGLSDAIYQIDWILMTISERKDLLIIMKRSTRPIKFTSSFLVTLSLESYANILKTSYSALNVLQQS